jgi:hypothetical protein
VRGSSRIRAESQPGAPERGKKAPERSHMGMRTRFMTAWKPWTESSTQAKAKPIAVIETASTARTAAAASPEATVRRMPASGASARKTIPCSQASVAPPNTLPATIENRETGATSTPWRNPSWRSSMREMVEKIAAKRMTSTMVPGKKYSR